MLSRAEKVLLLRLRERGGKDVRLSDLGDDPATRNAASWLEVKGYLKGREEVVRLYSPGPEAVKALERGLPEERALRILAQRGGEVPLRELTEEMGKAEAGVAVGHLRALGLSLERGVIRGTAEVIEAAEKEIARRKEFLRTLAEGRVPEGELDPDLLRHFAGRKGYLRREERTERYLTLTDRGWNEEIEVREEISQLTPELLATGRWRDVDLRPYDVRAPVPRLFPGKPHPLTGIIERIRRIMLEMGFTEITGEFVQSAFWNMDALFIPQDHPARELQDTLYLSKPSSFELPEYAESVREIHRKGWKYEWSEEEARKALLRTHTTVNTIRYLYEHPEPPVKVFSVERVFRRESIDATHLPEFTQIEGIVAEEGANFDMLVGILKTFYAKMGFERIRVRPSYFPYTEPSLEVEVHYNGQWLELGGAGIFRPEVTEPLGVDVPVLAWGLGLERLAMITLGLTDIRDLYISDVEWLRDAEIL